MASDPALREHQEWLGYLQPVGLVVSPPALIHAQAHVDRDIAPLQERLRAMTRLDGEERPVLDDLAGFLKACLDWRVADLWGDPGGPELPGSLALILPEYHEELRPTFAASDPANPEKPQMLIQVLPVGTGLDADHQSSDRGWHAPHQIRFERLLRETDTPIGLLFNGHALRLVHAPRGETSGHVTFPIAEMLKVSGRPILGALRMLLSGPRVFRMPENRRLLSLLKESRRYQNTVSSALAEQVLEALYALLRGFETAQAASGHRLLSSYLAEAPEEIYGGLLTTLMRMVFILFAEDRGLLPAHEVYTRHYSLLGLHEKLREDYGRHGDTMHQRFGAWAQLLTLFRLIHDGGAHGKALSFPPRHGELFNPDAYPFLEGRPLGVHRDSAPVDVPRVPDGAVYEALSKLLILDGERLSYRALDVEQIGSVYEAMMGFEIQVARGPSLALGSSHVVVNLQELLERSASERVNLLADEAKVKLSGATETAFKKAMTLEELTAALSRRVSKLTPDLIPAGSLFLQPGEERRRSGSHYTPRALTRPIVETAFRPIWEGLGEHPTPEQILALKVCDPAMGSGAFLVEACRHLADKLVEAWAYHKATPSEIPPDEDMLLFARREVAQRCLYGVDRNRFAVSLAKLSLWLATLAREHPFTFLDHALRCGDSLVGLSKEQIARLTWETDNKKVPDLVVRRHLDGAIGRAIKLRRKIQAMSHSDDTGQKSQLLKDAHDAMLDVERVADLVVARFFEHNKSKARESARKDLIPLVSQALGDKGDRDLLRQELEKIEPGVVPSTFHWELEFPEVFEGKESGFDVFVGNPPFAGKNTIAAGNPPSYVEWLKALHVESHGAADLVAHFYRRAFNLLKPGGTFGLIATNTIAQGDTRSTGLCWICENGGTLYAATKRFRWPGAAAVVVSIVHAFKGQYPGTKQLDGREVGRITAFLFHAGGNENPIALKANEGKSFQGSIVLGKGFIFDDSTSEATSLADMERLISANPKNQERIFPYIGGEEVNTSPTQAHHRYVINFGDMSEEEALRGWPDLMAIVEAKVKPERLRQGDKFGKEKWWLFLRARHELQQAIASRTEVLVNSLVSTHMSFAFLPSRLVFSHKLGVFPIESKAFFGIVQCRVHEVWARFFSSTLGEGLNYSPSDCFETFPFPHDWEANLELEAIGKTYYEHRAGLMLRLNEGMTKVYNRFHDPEETDPDVLRLRELHAAMDKAVLDAYGWKELDLSYEFFPEGGGIESDEEAGTSSRRKKYRLRWPDELHDEVLAKLLDLNAQYAAKERAQAGKAHQEGKVPPAATRRVSKSKSASGNEMKLPGMNT